MRQSEELAGHGAVASTGPIYKFRRSAWTALKKWLAEPLLHFVVLGILLYAINAVMGDTSQRYTIAVTPELVANLRALHARQFGNQPDDRQTQSLIDQYIRDEMLYREGMALHLDDGDEIVRRRIVQKMNFLIADTAAIAEPSEQQLETFYRSHQAQYVTPGQIAFKHLYFSADNGGDAAAYERTENALKILAARPATALNSLGDAFPGADRYANLSAVELRHVFGDSPLSRQLFDVQPRQWSGPVRSGYGWHLVFVETKTPARTPALADIRPQLSDDYKDAARAENNTREFARYRDRYTVVRGDNSVRQ